jgi:phosphinothricin acetyltransferase
VQIRLMNESDAQDIADILNDAIDHSVAHFGLVNTSVQEVLDDWRSTREIYPWLVARDDQADNKFLGFAKASMWKSRKAYTWTTETGIYMAQGSQGKGIGKALYGVLFDMLKKQGYHIALSGVSVPNPASERLHTSMGMEIAGEISPAGFKLDLWIPVRIYQKNLQQLNKEPGEIRDVKTVWDEIQSA